MQYVSRKALNEIDSQIVNVNISVIKIDPNCIFVIYKMLTNFSQSDRTAFEVLCNFHYSKKFEPSTNASDFLLLYKIITLKC